MNTATVPANYKPTEKEAYMNPVMLEYFKHRLMQWKSEIVREADETVRVGAALRARGFLVGAVRPPTVPPGTSRLRIAASAAHTDGEADALLEALASTLPRRCA